MKRRRSREYALQILFQLELTDTKLNDEIINAFWKSRKNEPDDVKDFTRRIVIETIENLDKIDAIIIKAAEHWSLERMAVIDRNILRTATYELSFREDIPASVTINEALEIAKKFSTKDSAFFINGILDKVANEIPRKKKTKSKK